VPLIPFADVTHNITGKGQLSVTAEHIWERRNCNFSRSTERSTAATACTNRSVREDSWRLSWTGWEARGRFGENSERFR